MIRFLSMQRPWHPQKMNYDHGVSQKLKAIAVALIAGVLVSCSEQKVSSHLVSYGTKLERVLDQPLPVQPDRKRAQFPDERSLQLEIAPLNIDLLDFLELGGCELQQVVAERNTSLGKFAADSVLLVQDIRFIALSRACLEQLPPDAELAATLMSAVKQKQLDMDKRIWNAIFAGPEYREFWHINLDQYPQDIDSRVEFALQNLLTLVVDLRLGHEADLAQFESSLEVLRNGEAGALLESWRLVGQYLDQASELLRDRFERRPLCFPEMVSPDSEIFRNVVMQEFIGGIQRDAAILNRRYFDVILPLQQLEAQLQSVEPDAYRAFRMDRDQMLQVSKRSLENHVAALRPLMMQCGFLPESNNDE